MSLNYLEMASVFTKNETQFCELPVYLPSSDTQFRKQFFGAHCKISISLEATFNPAQLTVHWPSIFQQSIFKISHHKLLL